MKLVLGILVALTGASAQAADGVSIPSQAKLIHQAKGFSGGYGAHGTIEGAVNNARQNARAFLDGGLVSHFPFGGTEERGQSYNVEYNCKAIYFRWGNAYERPGTGCNNWGSRVACVNYFDVNVDVLCLPREYSEKVAISASQACEREPKVECMSKPYMDMFAKIKQTRYIDVWR